MSALSKKRRRSKPQMNVTPLVDVVLVLLIIFMVVIPLMEQNAPVDLPSLFNVDPEGRARNNALELTVQRDGTLYLESERLPRAEVASRLRTAHEEDPQRRLILRADRDAPYREVRSVFAECSKIGFPGMGMRVNQQSQEAGGGH